MAFFLYYGSQFLPAAVRLATFFKISYFVFNRVWFVCKWWHNLYFWVNYPLSLSRIVLEIVLFTLCIFILNNLYESDLYSPIFNISDNSLTQICITQNSESNLGLLVYYLAELQKRSICARLADAPFNRVAMFHHTFGIFVFFSNRCAAF